MKKELIQTLRKSLALIALATFITPLSMSAQDTSGRSNPKPPIQAAAEVIMPERFDVTPRPLRDMPDVVPTGRARGGRDFEPGRPVPIGNTNPNVKDPLELQSRIGTLATIEPKASTNGVPVDPNYRVAPPDTTGDVGPSHYVQWVNLRYSVYNLTRNATTSEITGFSLASGFPKNGNAIFAGFSGACQNYNDGDPLVQYDQAADRWILTQFAVSSSPFYQCVAVSTSGDPTGTYYRYAYSFGTDFNDFPKMGIWNDSYVITYNIFKRGRTFGGNRVCAYERSKMLLGENARSICATTSTSYHSLLPADVEGLNQPASSTVPLLSIGSSSLYYWKYAVNWGAGTATLSGPTTVSGVAAFSRACSGGACVPQPGTTNKLDSLADRLNYRLSYRKFADGRESLLVNHAVAANGASGIRWYELRNATNSTVSAATPVVYQQGTFSPDSDYRWMGSAAMDKTGGIAIGYNISNSSSLRPGIRYTGRGPGDTLGSMGTEVNLLTGVGSQTGTLTRWGDYSMLSVDPVDGCTFVFTTEHIPENGSFNWTTHIGSFKLSTCP